jgi:uncharacterized protein with gpF-like domain
MMELRNPGKRDKTLAPITPNAQTRIKYERALDKAVANMQASYEWWIGARYRAALKANQGAARLAMDAAPGGAFNDLFGELKRLKKYWTNYFDKFSKTLAEQMTESWYKDNATPWQGKLKRAGFDVPMQLTPSQKLILKTKVPENVALIKSIQEQYHGDIEGIVSRNFLKGRDLYAMAEEIKQRGKVTQNRAAFIARDQANKATSQMNDARQRELGIKYCTWQHSTAGKEPREKHVRAGREQWVFKVGNGIDFGDQFKTVLPGEAINCKCTSRSIIPALGRGDIESDEDLEPVPGYPGAYRAKAGKSAGKKQKMDVTKTRSPAGSPVKYS